MRIVGLPAAVVTIALLVQTPPDNAPRPAPPSSDDSRIVCVNEQVLGSRLDRRRVCRTRAEWRQYKSETKDMVDRVQTLKPCRIGEGPC
jgi:hypothetical protein